MSRITVKALAEHYKVWSVDRGKTQILNSLTEHGMYNVDKYLCHVIKVKAGCYQVPGFKQTSNLETLLENAKSYTNSLKYNTEFYNPQFREGYFEYMAVNEYLKELGFESDRGFMNDVFFVLKRENVYKGKRENIVLSIDGLDYFPREGKSLPEKVNVVLHKGDYSWISIKNIKRHPDYIIPEIEALLKPLLMVDSANDFKMSTKLEAKDIHLKMETLMNDFSLQSEDYKEELKKSLRETLAALEA